MKLGFSKLEIALVGIVASCVLLLLGANIARHETEQRVIREQQIYVEDGQAVIEYNGEIYVHGQVHIVE